MSANAGDDGVFDEVYGIRGAGVLGLAVVVVVGSASVRSESRVLEHAAEAQGVPDLRFVLARELDALGVASAFEVENTVRAPSMLVIADQVARGIGGQCGLARPR